MKCKGTNRKGEPCENGAVKGREYCKFHGGHVPRGPEHWNYQGRGWSKYLPAYLAEKYKESLEDPELLEYRESIALLNARRKAIVEAGESQLLWAKAREAFRNLMRANAEKDDAGIRASLDVLHNLINRGHADSLRWREALDLIEREGRAKEREHKRLERMEAMISAEQFLAFVGLMVNVITQNVKDKDILRAITRSIDSLWAAQGVGANNTVH